MSAAATAAAVQQGASNVNVSIRVGSPGDNGGVAQTIATAVDAAAQTASAPATTPEASAIPPVVAAAAEAAVVQAAPANVDLSVRIASPGSDGAVTQTITAAATAAVGAAAQAQYQPPAPQYQPPAPANATAPPPPPSASSTEPAPIAASQVAPSLPSAWTWNWTWTCGDISGGGITQTIDTGIQNWVWRWNLGGMCTAPPALQTEIPAVIPPVQSEGQEPTPPTPPTLPTLPVVQLPALTPAPPSLLPALVQPAAAAELAPAAFEPLASLLPPTAMQVQPVTPMSLLLVQRRPAPPPRFLTRSVAAWSAGPTPATPRARAAESTRHRQPNAQRPAAFTSLGFVPPSSGGGAASGGGGAGAGAGVGVTTALAIWILLALPGLAVLRLPASRRGPRAHVDDTRTRPG